ncbi:MAG: corrinoid protein [Planctomycetota bacterium]|jgi:5-methyltetrahydrofolate--homocysteine methyltransferase
MAPHEIIQAVLAFDREACARAVRAALDRGEDAKAVLDEGLLAAMDDVGERYVRAEFFVPEMMMAAEAMKEGLAVLTPRLAGEEGASRGRVVIGTVHGDRHDIGKNLVALMLECAGFEVFDLGVDVEAERFVEAAEEKGADLVAMSALINTTMPAMEAAVSRIRSEAGGRKTLVGGAPVTRAFADKIGADGYSPDAPGAAAEARKLIGTERP